MTDETELSEVPETQDAPEVEASTPAAAATAPAWGEDDEQEARAFGWKPSTEWQGDKPQGYIEDPREWMGRVTRSRTFTAMQERLEKTERENAEQKRRMEALNASALQRQRAEFEAQLQRIQVQQREAVRTSDEAAFDRLEKDRAALVRQAVETTQAPQASSPPVEVENYRKANEWTQNPLIWDEAVKSVDMALRAGRQFANEKDQIAFAESVIRQKYPHMFKAEAPAQTARPARQVVDGGGMAATRSSGGFNSLPADAKAQFARFAKDGLFQDNEAGRKAYYEEYNNA